MNDNTNETTQDEAAEAEAMDRFCIEKALQNHPAPWTFGEICEEDADVEVTDANGGTITYIPTDDFEVAILITEAVNAYAKGEKP